MWCAPGAAAYRGARYTRPGRARTPTHTTKGFSDAWPNRPGRRHRAWSADIGGGELMTIASTWLVRSFLFWHFWLFPWLLIDFFLTLLPQVVHVNSTVPPSMFCTFFAVPLMRRRLILAGFKLCRDLFLFFCFFGSRTAAQLLEPAPLLSPLGEGVLIGRRAAVTKREGLSTNEKTSFRQKIACQNGGHLESASWRLEARRRRAAARRPGAAART